MRFPSSLKRKPQELPVTEPRASQEMLENSRKDSATVTPPTIPSKPQPTRTTSTRIQEPTSAPSRMKGPGLESGHDVSVSGSGYGKPERPGLQRRRTTAQTRYIDMLLELDTVPKLHNFGASFFTWILLAGYIVFPATFNKLQEDEDLDQAANNALQQHALDTVRNVPLLYIAAFACGIGVFGSFFLWWKHRKNYVWVINRVFLPALMNSIAGLISTLVNIYSAQDGQYSVTARVTIIVTAVSSVVAVSLFLLYNSIMLKLVKRKHEKETKEAERSLTGGQSYVDKQREKRKVAREEKAGKGHVVGVDPGRVV
ncbi:hypothetical protein EJ04DRAFT_343867 [Polyplosphaeria fusca]|uniref:Uncharacterized protein n=1 Tax=Polyplosphaeria fusca TaxID=682080 RepID=A0A9P4QW87_9PLEO|nr:hypothetical protein EJ04DRAFT_343867 [Polyplosphaeria fusca]